MLKWQKQNLLPAPVFNSRCFFPRTDPSPDTTTKDLSPPMLPASSSPYHHHHHQQHQHHLHQAADTAALYQPSFLAYSAGEVPMTARYVMDPVLIL
jgi:hypothetical protein